MGFIWLYSNIHMLKLKTGARAWFRSSRSESPELKGWKPCQAWTCVIGLRHHQCLQDHRQRRLQPRIGIVLGSSLINQILDIWAQPWSNKSLQVWSNKWDIWVYLYQLTHGMGSPHVICYMFCMQGTPASKPTGTRMTKLTDQQKEDIMNMAGPACMDSQERKRQYSYGEGYQQVLQPHFAGQILAMLWWGEVWAGHGGLEHTTYPSK